MSRIKIFFIASMTAMLVLSSVASEQTMSNVETRLKSTIISMNIIERYPLKPLLTFLCSKAKCDLSFEVKDEHVDPRNRVLEKMQDLDITVGSVSNRQYVTHMSVTNVAVYELLNAVIEKAELMWRLSEAGVVIVAPDSAAGFALKSEVVMPIAGRPVDWGKSLMLLTNGMTRAEVEMIVPQSGGTVLIARSLNEYKITYNVDDMTAITLGYDYTGIEAQLRNEKFHEWSSLKNPASRLRNVYGVSSKEKSKNKELIEWFDKGVMGPDWGR